MILVAQPQPEQDLNGLMDLLCDSIMDKDANSENDIHNNANSLFPIKGISRKKVVDG